MVDSHVTLMGTEQIANAGRRIYEAAELMLRVGLVMQGMTEQLERILREDREARQEFELRDRGNRGPG